MSKVWREYGVITILLVVSVGGYLLLTRSNGDLLATTMDRLTEHLISLVPDDEGKELTEARMADLRARVADREVTPEQLELFTASVLNVHSMGDDLDHAEAEMIIQLAFNEVDQGEMPEFVPDATLLPTPAAPPSMVEMKEVGERMDRVVTLYSEVRRVAPAEASARSAPPVHFRADKGLRIIMDERLRSRVEGAGIGMTSESSDMLEWQWELAESLQEERQHRWDEAEELVLMANMAETDSLTLYEGIESLTMLRKFESRGFIAHPAVESLAVALKFKFEVQAGEAAIRIATETASAIAIGVGAAAEAAATAPARPPRPRSGN